MSSLHQLQLAHVRVDLTFWINAHKANAAGKVPVSLRITVNGQRAEVSTGIRCLPTRWDKATKRLMPAGRADEATKKLNTVLDDLEAKARLLASDLRTAATPERPLTAARLRAALLPPPPAPVPCALALLTAAAAQQANQFTQATYQTAVNALRRFCAATLPLPDLTAAYAQRLAAWLTAEVGARATAIYLTQLRALYGQACPQRPNPFGELVTKSAQTPAPARPRYVLSKPEIAALRALPLTGREAVARDVYLAQYYLLGSRVGVVLELTWGQVDWQRQRVAYKAEKSGPWQDVAIRPPLAAILAAYYPGPGAHGLVFPVLPADYASQAPRRRYLLRKAGNTYVWRGLQRIARLLALPGRLHSHTARHSLATHTVEKTGNYRLAKEFLGHGSLAVTERYIRPMLAAELDAGADEVYGE